MWYAHHPFNSRRFVYDQLYTAVSTDVYCGGRLRGTADKFYTQKQLLPENFAKAANGKGNVNLRMQEGYDHIFSWPVLQMIMLIMRPSIFTTDFVFDLLVARFRI